MKEEPTPTCWRCGSKDVAVKFVGYKRAYCLKGCTEVHVHHEDIAHHALTCRACGLAWRDGSGDFAVEQ